MSWSWKICRVSGIPIYVHWTFLLLIAYVVYSTLAGGQGLAAAAYMVAYVLALFACVVLHELGHALTAQRFGVSTTSIVLLPIGGVARLQRIPENPAQELAIALAGPAVNLVIAASLWIGGTPLPVTPVHPHAIVAVSILSNLLVTNLFLALFNLLPAFPMDGGRVLRALLAMWLDYAVATRAAATVGKLMALAFAIFALEASMPLLVVIALFVWIGADAEASQVEERAALRGVAVREAMLTDYETLAPEHTLGHAAEVLLAGSQTDFPVARDGEAVGVLSRSDLLAGLARGGATALVADYMKPSPGNVEAGEPLVLALNRLRESQCQCMQVFEAGQPVGLLTLENIGEFLMVRAALDAAHAHQVAV
ncbi:MAG TPA: site-2 protease family protein [Isosphaeraceae bacterium]|nr:site-2 protease family protein [Isosphaeraceae bacterium]